MTLFYLYGIVYIFLQMFYLIKHFSEEYQQRKDLGIHKFMGLINSLWCIIGFFTPYSWCFIVMFCTFFFFFGDMLSKSNKGFLLAKVINIAITLYILNSYFEIL